MKQGSAAGYCVQDLRPALATLVERCPYDKFVHVALRGKLAFSDDNAALLSKLNEQLANKIMHRAALFAQQRTRTTSAAMMRAMKVTLLHEDQNNAVQTLSQ